MFDKVSRFDDGTIRIPQSIDLITMDEEIKDRFNAIAVTAKMLGEPPPDGVMCTLDMLPIDGESKEILNHIGLPLTDWTVHTGSHTYIWSKDINGNYNDYSIYMFIECENDYTIKYPVKCYEVTSLTYNQAKVLNYELKNKDDVILLLDNILCNA